MSPSSAHSRRGPFGRLAAKVKQSWTGAKTGSKTLVIVAIVLVLGLVGVGVGLATTSKPKHSAGGTTTTTTTTTLTVPVTTRVKGHVDTHLCPLRGTRAPGGKVQQRPAVGVKIGNDPASRPQSGLPDADIVYEEMAEGGITRYLAIFQCYEPAAIGPTRSVRWDDWHILASYGHPILAFSGGITPWTEEVASLPWLFDASGSAYPTANAYYRTSNRVPPWNYYTSAKGLWGLDPKNHETPPAQFVYSARPAAGTKRTRGASVADFASAATVQWEWSAHLGAWLRFVGGEPDVDVSGAQLRATDVVIDLVQTQPGPYNESGPNSPDVESLTQGTGPAWILRNGMVEEGTWSCPQYGDITRYHFRDGKTMTLAPGNTWVELVPDKSYAVSIQH